MNTLAETAPAFVQMAHRIVWCRAATVDTRGRPRSRILHPIWQLVGYDPAIVPGWDRFTSDDFAVLRVDPWRLRVFPGTVLLGQGGAVLNWRA